MRDSTRRIFEELLRDILSSYYRGLTGSECPFWGSIDCDRMVAACARRWDGIYGCRPASGKKIR